MVENAREHVGEAPRVGRPPKFDRDAVVSSAIGSFMAGGYAGTTLSELEGATGVDRSTLYNSFGGKAGLYDAATTAYLANARTGLFAPLHEGSEDGLADVAEFLRRLRAGLTGGEISPGCLIVNDMAAGAAPEAAAAYREMLESGLQAALRRSAFGSDAALVEARASVLASTVIGINLISGHTGDPDQVAPLIDAAEVELRSWG